MCWKCGNSISFSEPVSRDAVCPVCNKDLHSCKNCKFYSPGSHYDCHETVDENVIDKERSNFCEHFKLKKDFSSTKDNSKAQLAMEKLNSLFSI